jgi:predicted HicB family RNase H-like nuclease
MAILMLEQSMYMERPKMYKEKIVNVETGEDFTAAEIAEVEKAQAESAARIAELAAKDAARKAIFDKLGITEEEARLLLGGN